MYGSWCLFNSCLPTKYDSRSQDIENCVVVLTNEALWSCPQGQTDQGLMRLIGDEIAIQHAVQLCFAKSNARLIGIWAVEHQLVWFQCCYVRKSWPEVCKHSFTLPSGIFSRHFKVYCCSPVLLARVDFLSLSSGLTLPPSFYLYTCWTFNQEIEREKFHVLKSLVLTLEL